jgi:hypothetical protein
MARGSQTAVSGRGKAKPAGITPITCVGTPSMRTVRPGARGSPPSLRRHSASLSTATGGAPGRSSPASNARPRAGATPNTANSVAVARADGTRSGTSPPVRLTSPRR